MDIQLPRARGRRARGREVPASSSIVLRAAALDTAQVDPAAVDIPIPPCSPVGQTGGGNTAGPAGLVSSLFLDGVARR